MAQENEDIKNIRERYKLQEQIRKSIENATESFETFSEAQKEITERYKLIKQLLQQATELEKLRTEESEKEAKILREQAAQLVQLNKETSKFVNVLKTSANVLGKNILPSIINVGKNFLDLDQKARNAAASIGLGNDRMYLMRQNVIQAGVNMAHYGVTIDQAIEAQSAYSEELGRSVILTESALANMAQIGKATGLGMEGVAGMTAQMEAFGMGAEQSADFIFNMYSESAAMGLNAGKVVKKFQQNLELMNKLSFKNGINGMKKLVQLSEKYKIDMNAIAQSADKAFRPEGAIEMAAQLQVLGGSLASLGDPFQLMYKARNNPEKFLEDITQAAKQSATWDPKTKEFKVSAYEMDRLRVASEATGISMEELVKTARQGAKIDMVKGLLGGKGLTSEDQDTIAMLSQMVDGKAQIQMGFKDGKAIMKDISNLSQKELLSVLEEKKKAEEAAATATGMREQWQNLLNEFIVALYPLLETLQKEFVPIVKKLTEWGKSFTLQLKEWMNKLSESPLAMFLLKYGVIIGAIGKVFSPLFSAAAWFLKGIWLSKGFDTGMAKGGFLSKMGSFFKGLNPFGGKGGGVSPVMGPSGGPPVPDQKNFDSINNNMTKTGGIASMSASQLLAFGAAMLMIGGAVAIAALGIGELVQSFKGLTGEQILGALVSILLLGWGLVALVGALGTVSAVTEGPILAVGFGLLMIGGAVALAAWGMSTLVDSFSNMFKVIGPNGASLLLAGAGFMMMSMGIGMLTMSLIAMGAAAIFALPGLLMLGKTTQMLTQTASALAKSGGGEGMTKAINAINSVDENKLKALKDLSMWMALLGASPTIKFDESLHVDGTISLTGDGGGKTSTDWIKDPIFVSKLKQLIKQSESSDLNGGKGK